MSVVEETETCEKFQFLPAEPDVTISSVKFAHMPMTVGATIPTVGTTGSNGAAMVMFWPRMNGAFLEQRSSVPVW